jgi:mannosylglycerate hydrolase
MNSLIPHTIVVVSHTHWDREWYHPLGRMRQRLARLVDELLDAPDGLPFLLDGQSIVIDDYRAMRPMRSDDLRLALQSGQLEAGPWYVLPDLLIPSGEALVRNLLEGTRTVREAGGTAPDVLYSPDAFGHSAAGPVLAQGFGLRVAVVWRGFGGNSHPDSTIARWTHASGAEVLLYHLPKDGYEIGSSLPTEPNDAAQRWNRMRDDVLGANAARVSLLPNGADHHARQTGRVDAIGALAHAAQPHIVMPGTLSGFSQRLVAAAAQLELPEVHGELRDSSGWTWSLQGTFATRAHQKRVNAQVERLLVRDTEPWLALAWFSRGFHDPSLRMAWKTLLSAHPHDTLCGCSVDDVASAADQRWADARVQAIGLRDDALRALVGHNAAADRERESVWTPALVLRNPAPRRRGGAVRVALIDTVVADPVGPGSAAMTAAPRASASPMIAAAGEKTLQVMRRSSAFDRVESPLHYPRNAVVQVVDVMAWIESLPGYAVQTVAISALGDTLRPVPDAECVVATSRELRGRAWHVSTTADGVIARHVTSGVSLPAFGRLESTTDAGDTYTPSPRGDAIVGAWSSPMTSATGPLRAEWQVSALLSRPRTSIAPATAPLGDVVEDGSLFTIAATATLALTAGTNWLEVKICGENPAGDHRLRWILPLPDGVDHAHVLADAAFGAVQRTSAQPPSDDWHAESTLPTAPLHRWLCLSAATHKLGIISDGLAEYEILPSGELAITLVRAVGELSRRDLPERPGHAGWPAATPLAQSIGPFEARFALLILPADHDAAIAQLEWASDDFLTPTTGDTWRGVATPLQDFAGLTLVGDGLSFSAAKRSEDGEWLVLRCVNQRRAAVQGTWHLPRAAAEARHSRLDETPGEKIAQRGDRILFDAAPYAVVTILIK